MGSFDAVVIILVLKYISMVWLLFQTNSTLKDIAPQIMVDPCLYVLQWTVGFGSQNWQLGTMQYAYDF